MKKIAKHLAFAGAVKLSLTKYQAIAQRVASARYGSGTNTTAQ